MLITSTGGNQTVRTNVLSGNLNNGIEIAGDASGVTVVPTSSASTPAATPSVPTATTAC